MAYLNKLTTCPLRSGVNQEHKIYQVLVLEVALMLEFETMVWDRAIHDGNFLLYIDTLLYTKLLFHVLDFYNFEHV